MTDTPPRSGRNPWLTIALLSAALLAFQVLLTRVCALRLHFHFGFLIISNSLLGIGASGSLLALVEARWRKAPETWIFAFGLLFVASLPATWAYLLLAPIPESLKFETWTETLQFAGFNLACAVPFFFGGTAVGLLLAANAARVHSVYAADLLGAGFGCLLCPLLLWPVGAGGCFLATLALAVLAAWSAAPAGTRVALRASLLVVLVLSLGWLYRFDRDFPVPGKRWLDLTQSHTIREYGRPVFSQWSANSRIDVLPLPANAPRFLQARGATAMAMPLPEQWWIGQDGDAGTLLSNFGEEPDKLPVLAQTMYAASFALKQGSKPRVFVIGVGGAPDLWAAKIHDCSLIRGIELNQAILDLHRTAALRFSRPLLEDPRVQLVCDEGRSALMRTDERFDVIQLTGIDTWTALNSGAYVLAENYLYTVEACRAMYERLADGGILQITRMAAGMETIRLLHNMYAALPPAAQADFAASVAAFRTPDNLMAVLLKKGRYSDAEVAQLEQWASGARIDRVVLPGRPLGTEVEEFVTTTDKPGFVAGYEYDITPTTDDRPYFFSFLRWDRPETAKKNLHQPTWIVQGNPLFLRNQLLYSGLAALLLIVLPLLFRSGTRSASRAGALPFLVYFAGLGFGFIGVEVALIQKFTLLLGQPLYSIVVTLFAILIATGIGSWASARWIRNGMTWVRAIPLLVLGLLVVLAFGSEGVVSACIGLPLFLRAAVVVLLVAPVGFLLGMPFAHGIAIVERVNPSFVPWAWAVNGSTTVVGSIATVIVSMNFGFSSVLLLSGLIYLVAFAALDGIARRSAAAA